MIQLDNTSVNAPYGRYTFYVDALYEGATQGGVSAPVCPSWITFDYIGGAQYSEGFRETYEFNVDANSGDVRMGLINFECQDTSGQTWTNHTTVVQGCGIFTYAPIWKDTYYFANHLDVFEYSLKYNGVSVYFGKAYCGPGDGGPMVQVNKICQNFLKNNIELTEGVHSNDGAYGVFSLCNSEGLELGNYVFLMDYGGVWSGETGYVMTEPINGHLDPRMYVMHTQYNNVQTTVNYEIDD